MANLIDIADAGDARVDDFRDLHVADRRPDRPGGRGLVIAEGVVVVRRLLGSRYPIRAVLGVPRRIEELADSLAGLDIPAYRTDPDTMARVVGFHLNRGVLAVADRAGPPALGEVLGTARTVAVLEGVGDHENLGGLFRNAAALGVDAVLLGPGCPDPLYRRSVRVSMGHVLHVPFVTGVDLDDAVKSLHDNGFTVTALTPSTSGPLRPVGPRAAVLLGSEGHGLSAHARAAADAQMRIPMANGVDSLNVATAAAVAFYVLGQDG